MDFLLHRINPEKNEARFYFIQVGRTLLDECAVIRMWGRIGGYQKRLITPCATWDDAHKLATRLRARRLRRGYVEV